MKAITNCIPFNIVYYIVCYWRQIIIIFHKVYYFLEKRHIYFFFNFIFIKLFLIILISTLLYNFLSLWLCPCYLIFLITKNNSIFEILFFHIYRIHKVHYSRRNPQRLKFHKRKYNIKQQWIWKTRHLYSLYL